MANTNNPFMPIPGGAPMPGASVSPVTTDNYEIDLSGVEEKGGFTIPDGLYQVKCVNIDQTVSKGGNPMFVWDFEVADGPHKGFLTKVFTALTPAAMWKVAETVTALGVGQSGQVVKFKRSDVIGKICGALIEQSEYDGKKRSQISRVMTLKEMQEAN